MSVQINPGGLSGLIMKISDELNEGKSFDEILSNYPISKTSLPYLLKLQEEYSKMFLEFVREEYAPLEKENLSLKDKIKQYEGKKDDFDTQYIAKLQNELERLKNENLSLKTENERLLSDVEEQEKIIQDYELLFSFISSSLFGRILLKRFEDAKSRK